MKAKEARELGERIAEFVRAGQIAQAYALLSPVLAERTPFPMLRRIGKVLKHLSDEQRARATRQSS